MEKVKLLPYGIMDFEDLRRKNRYFVDKTMYIPKMECVGDFLFIIRPRRFGKSMFLTMLADYYDIEKQSCFDELFADTWIHDNPTKEKGQYQVLALDFSKASSGNIESLQNEFHEYCSYMLIGFAKKYAKYYEPGFVEKLESIHPKSILQMTYLFNEAKRMGHQLYLIIDEYDNFTNDVLNEHGEKVYHALTHASGFYREIFKKFKGSFQRILMMGVSPVTLDDLTSGFNIARNITADPRFNMMLGFSETDVREMIRYYQSAGIITADEDSLIEDMKPWYDNYCFAEDSYGRDPSMFNCNMVLHYLNTLCETGKKPKEMLDKNTRTDYNKLRKLVELDTFGDDQHSYLRRIITDGTITAKLESSFPAESMLEPDNFISLLYYYGMLTITGSRGSMLKLGIPNNSVRSQYYDYILKEFQRVSPVSLQWIRELIMGMAYEGRWRDLLTAIAEKYKGQSSVRSAIEGERNVQGYFTAYLGLLPLYIMAPEVELNHGYCDLFLLPDLKLYPDVEHSYIIELKYLKATDGDDKAAKQWTEAVEQIHKYAQGAKVQLMAGNTTLHCIIIQMRDYDLVRIDEV